MTRAAKVLEIPIADTGNFSAVEPMARHRLTTEFTRELTDLCRKHAVAIDGGRLESLDLNWNGPDAEKWEQYALNEDDFLVRGFWNQHPRAIVR
jgi:FPC/CPF motif-containing protein YcgG